MNIDEKYTRYIDFVTGISEYDVNKITFDPTEYSKNKKYYDDYVSLYYSNNLEKLNQKYIKYSIIQLLKQPIKACSHIEKWCFEISFNDEAHFKESCCRP